MHIPETEEGRSAYTPAQAEVRKKTFDIIGERDWLMGRKKEGSLKELRAWQTSYENSWPQHEGIEYLKRGKCPIQWESIDNLEELCIKLIKMSKCHRRYVELHTQILEAAYEWDTEGRPTSHLLRSAHGYISMMSNQHVNFYLKSQKELSRLIISCFSYQKRLYHQNGVCGGSICLIT